MSNGERAVLLRAARGRIRPTGDVAEEAWANALAWYMRASDEDVMDLYAIGPDDRDSKDWLKLAVMALDQGGVDPRAVSL